VDVNNTSQLVLIILSLTCLLLCVKSLFPYLFYAPSYLLCLFHVEILEKLRLKILAELDDGVVASRKQVLYWKLVKSLRRTEKEILEGIEGKDMKAQAAGSSVSYTPVTDNNREDKAPFSVVMRKMTRDQVNEFASDRIGIDKGGRVKSLRDQAVRCAVTVGQMSGWKNLFDENGNAIKFDPSNRKLSYDMLPVSVQEELEAVFGSGGYDATVEARIIRAEKKRVIDQEEEDREFEAAMLLREESAPTPSKPAVVQAPNFEDTDKT